MYPRRELTELAARKRLLQARIAVRRLECTIAAVELSRPLALVDRGIGVWRRISPFVKILGVPLGVMLTRVASRRRRGMPVTKGKFAVLMTALPLILRLIRAVREAIETQRARRGAEAATTATAASAAAAAAMRARRTPATP